MNYIIFWKADPKFREEIERRIGGGAYIHDVYGEKVIANSKEEAESKWREKSFPGQQLIGVQERE